MSELHVITDGLTDLNRPLEVGDPITGQRHNVPGMDPCRCGCQLVEGKVGEVIVALSTGRGHLVIGEFAIDPGEVTSCRPQIAFYQRLEEAGVETEAGP